MIPFALALALAAAPPKLAATKSTLANGMTVILAPDHSVPGVAVQVTYRVGSRDEEPGKTGFAHLFEHLMFMGSTHAPYPSFDTIMEAHGGSNNADTENDRTNYFESGPSNLLETFLWLEADRLQTLPDTMTDEKVTAQRLVVQNERRQSYENRPYGMAEIAIAENLFPVGHPYHWPVIGYHADLEAASTADVVAFFRRYYTPTNAILVIVGDFEPAEATALVQKYFGWMPAHPADRRPPTLATPLTAPKTLELTDKVELPKAVLAWNAPALGTPGDAANILLAHVLAGTRSSRLHQELVYRQHVSQEVNAYEDPQDLGSNFTIELLATPGHTAAEEIAAADTVLAQLAKDGPTQAELDAAKLNRRTQFARHEETLLARAMLLATLELRFGDPNAGDRELARTEALTTDDVRNAARTLVTQPRFTLTFKPGAKP